MITQIINTKLFIPRLRSDLVVRSRLMNLLEAQVNRKLTLISAPAGFGKTTVISEWSVYSDRPFAWVSLDEQDNHPIQFMTYMISALRTIIPNIDDSLLDALQTSPPAPAESVLSHLINELAASPDEIVLVLDDYHIVGSRPIDELMTFLLDHLPPQLHIVITTREDPSFAISRLRARRELTELRASDLRFTLVETTEFLNQQMGLSLRVDDIEKLETRTEGWIAGLQMAAISLHGRVDTTNFIENFTGSHRYILDYLVEEVLSRQSQPVVDFLLQTSILDRLCGSLCDAVTNHDDGQQMLEMLERNNMLVVPLDDERKWYRYHHLFADVLQAHFKNEQAHHLSKLHLRASKWYEQNGSRVDAVEYALLAGEVQHSADLMELSWPIIPQGIKPATWQRWAGTLPEDEFHKRPVLCAAHAWILLDHGELDAAEARLIQVEHWLQAISEQPETTSSMIIANQEQFVSLAGTTASARSYLSTARNDLNDTMYHAQRALSLLDMDQYYWRGNTGFLLGLALWANGNLEQAYSTIDEGISNFRRAGNLYFEILGAVYLANIFFSLGQLRVANRQYEKARALTQVDDLETSVKQVSVGLYMGLGTLHLQWNDLDTSQNYIQQGLALRERAIMSTSAYRLSIVMAQICAAREEFEDALQWLDTAQSDYQVTADPDLFPANAVKARIYLQQQRLQEATQLISNVKASDKHELHYLHEFEQLTRSRLLIALNETEEALTLLQQLQLSAESGGRVGSVIETLLLQALVHQKIGDLETAPALLIESLTLAEPEGYIRIFVDEGKPMRDLLSTCLSRYSSPAYVITLIDAIDQQSNKSPAATDPNDLLIEPLSNREREVLALLGDGRTNQEIADELVIALSTVKKHVNNILGKLSVDNRTQAVKRARELQLL